MSAAGGTADFFYRESQRLGYVARSALKVRTRALPVPISSRFMPLTRRVAAAADPDAEAAQAHHPGRRRARPRLRPRRVASGDDPFTLPCLLSSQHVISPHFQMRLTCPARWLLRAGSMSEPGSPREGRRCRWRRR